MSNQVDLAMARRLSEKALQDAIVEQAHNMGFPLVYHTLRSEGSEPGFYDLVMFGKGRCLFVECKSHTGRLTKGKWKANQQGRSIYHPGQEDWREAVEGLERPPEYHLWKPIDWYEGRIDDILR